MSATLVIALIGAATGIIGLAWQVASFTLTGARVKISGDASMASRWMWDVNLRASNSGRLDAYIVGLSIYFASGSHVTPTTPLGLEKVGYPILIKPGESRALRYRTTVPAPADQTSFLSPPFTVTEMLKLSMPPGETIPRTRAKTDPPALVLIALGTGKIIEGKIRVSSR